MKAPSLRISGKLVLLFCCAVLTLGLSGCVFDGESDLDVAWSALKKEDLNQAIRFSTRAITFGGLSGEKLSSAYECRAKASSQKNRYDQALEDMNRVVSMRPEYAGGYLERGDLLLHAGDFDRALADISRGLEIADPKGESKSASLAKRYISRGSIHLMKKAPEKAMADFEHALKLDPGSLDARMGRSYVLEDQGRKREALIEMELIWQAVSKQVFMPLSKQSVYLKRVIRLRMANGFDGATPANVIPAEAPPIPVSEPSDAPPAGNPGETPEKTPAEGSGVGDDIGPDAVSEKNLDKPLLGK
ncbi:MAG TPA: tetratricopeptide repeat protein [Candidatus Ozemobacteraceae bacterium]|nr:tetratricopeptide repeat protein [Candidatus Ozemobacteraceae bacterium]